MSDSDVRILAPAGLSRRAFHRILAGLAMSSLAPGCASDKSLNLFTWTSWGADGFLERARNQLGVNVRPTYYSSSDEMMAKLRAGGTKLYDMIVPTQNYVEPAVKASLIEPIDVQRLPNRKDVFHGFADSPQWRLDGKVYGIPFVWGANAIAYNRKETGDIASLDALFDPKFGGRIAMRDEPEDTLAIAALKLGIPKPYAMGEAELQEVKKLLISQKPIVRAYYKNVADVQNMLASGEVVIAWTFLAVVAPLRSAGVDIGWVWPKEGAIGWSESITPVRGTERLSLVEDYANFTLSSEYGEFMARSTGYAPTSEAAIARLEPELKQELGIDFSRVDRLVFKDIPPDKARWNEIWNEVKAA